MRRTLFAALLAAAVAGTAAAQNALTLQQHVVGRVDEDVVTLDDVRERMRFEIARARAAAESDPRTPEALFQDVLGRIIEEKLLLAEGRRLVAAREAWGKRLDLLVQQELERLRTRAGGDAKFRADLAAQNLAPEKFSDLLREEFLRKLVLEQFVTRDLSVSPAEVEAAYRQELDKYRVPEQVQYRQIFLDGQGAAKRVKAKETADYLMTLLKKQHDFAKLAQQYSEDTKAAEGGLWDFAVRGARPKPIDDLIFTLREGEIGGPVETDIGFTIIKVEARRPERIIPFEEAQEELALRLLRDRRLQRRSALLDRLKKEHYVEIVRP